TLIEQHGIAIRGVTAACGNAAYVHDRRSGERSVLAEMSPAPLSRHELDELYGAMLVEGLEASVCVLGGAEGPDVVPADTYRRLAHDLRTNGRTVVADLAGEPLRAVLDGGLTVLKVSDAELLEDGWAVDDSEGELLRVMSELRRAGARNVVLSRAEQPALALVSDELFRVDAPTLEALDHRGAGDSMTAGLAAGLAYGLPIESALRISAAAGALNVARHGLASGERAAIEELARHVQLRRLEPRVAATAAGTTPTTTPDELAAKATPDS
ncbi:MAG: PfkB family carbohydrate kinase, partial [Actinomycetota bacterium]|nr:PfkB family carbohydrate kinase [Actinomycetota bacterium]